MFAQLRQPLKGVFLGKRIRLARQISLFVLGTASFLIELLVFLKLLHFEYRGLLEGLLMIWAIYEYDLPSEILSSKSIVHGEKQLAEGRGKYLTVSPRDTISYETIPRTQNLY